MCASPSVESSTSPPKPMAPFSYRAVALMMTAVLCSCANTTLDPAHRWSDGWRAGTVSAVREWPSVGLVQCEAALRPGDRALHVYYRSSGRSRWVSVPVAAAAAPELGTPVVVNLRSCDWALRETIASEAK